MATRAGGDASLLDRALLGWISEFAGQGFLTTDDRLVICGWNAWLEQHSGRKASEVVGRPLLELFPDLSLRGLDAYYRSAIEGQARVVSQALHGYVLPLAAARQGGHEFVNMPQRGVIAPLFAGPRVIGTITVIDDVSERMLREAELRERIRALDAARAAAENAVRAKDEFLATLSHELRTPLSSVLGWAQILRTQRMDPGMLAHTVEVIERNAAAQLRLINDMLDMSRILTGKLRLEPSVVDLTSIAAAAMDVVTPAAAAKGVRLRSRVGAPVPPVFGDPDRLQQVVWNVLSNAVKFSDRGGTVELGIEPSGDHVLLVVRDEGQGIDPAFLPHVFERFRQFDASSSRRHGGLGLGLALVRQLVELHGGSVHLESPGVGQGTTVTIRLPAAGSSAQVSPAPGAPADAERTGAIADVHVLLVDDNADARDLLALALERQGARVTMATSSEEALKLLRGPGELPHVLVADLAMPGEDGFAMMRKIRALDPSRGGRIPAIAVTAYSKPEDRTRALAVGYQLFLVKPVDPPALIAAIADFAAQP